METPAKREWRLAEIILGMAMIVVLDLFAGLQIEYGAVFSAGVERTLSLAEDIGAAGFVVLVIAALIAGIRHEQRTVLKIFVVFLVFATIHLLANVFALVVTAHVRDDSYLWGVWDVGAAYLMIVAVFTGWYWVADELIAGGAFDFPVPADREAEPPNLIDYVFIAFNTNATFGPTSETVVSRKVKVLMMLQTVCSLVVLLVLVARIVGLGD
ncbi:MAG: hypothetical protein ACKOA9_05175 [Actinomycetota bacterium]